MGGMPMVRKKQVPSHAGEQILGGKAILGAVGGGLKSLAGQLFDGKKGVDFGQVGKDALGGAAGSIPLVGGMLKNKITGGGAQGQTPGMPQVPGAVGPGGFGGMFGQGGGQGLMGLAKNFMGMEHGGGIPHNPELAGAPYRMRGVRLMKSGGINEYGDGGTIDYAHGGSHGEIPGLDVKSRKTQVGGPVMRPEMAETTQIYIDGLPVSGAQAKAFVEEMREGSAGQGMPGLADALNAAASRRARDKANRGGREYMGGSIYRSKTAEQDFREAQRRQGASGLLRALEEYNTSRGTRDFGGGGYLR